MERNQEEITVLAFLVAITKEAEDISSISLHPRSGSFSGHKFRHVQFKHIVQGSRATIKIDMKLVLKTKGQSWKSRSYLVCLKLQGGTTLHKRSSQCDFYILVMDMLGLSVWLQKGGLIHMIKIFNHLIHYTPVRVMQEKVVGICDFMIPTIVQMMQQSQIIESADIGFERMSHAL
ncbi:hypothetical protein M8C21_005357, partial [Ambrosia artemisiifolia]